MVYLAIRNDAAGPAGSEQEQCIDAAQADGENPVQLKDAKDLECRAVTTLIGAQRNKQFQEADRSCRAGRNVPEVENDVTLFSNGYLPINLFEVPKCATNETGECHRVGNGAFRGSGVLC